jgi:opacity protein-like surface antigen
MLRASMAVARPGDFNGGQMRKVRLDRVSDTKSRVGIAGSQAVKSAGVALLSAAALVTTGAHPAHAAEPAPAVTAPTEQPAALPEKWPMKWDLGLFGGFEVISKDTGLGNAEYRTDGTTRNAPESSVMFGLRAGAWIMDQLGVELEGKMVPTTIAPSAAGGHATIYGLRANVLYQFMPEEAVRPFLIAGFGYDIFSAKESQSELVGKGIGVKSSDSDPAFLVGAGVKWQALHDIGLRLDARYLSTQGLSGHAVTGNFEGLLSIVYTIGGKPGDSDGDGILDPYDKCPEQAEDKDGFEDADGCPDLDNDKDGIPDTEDKCPNEAEDKDGFEDYDGCPDLDNDRDGVPDTQDKCPNEPETKNGFQDDDGCPDVSDRDHDGIPDDKDKCPDQPETKNGFQDEDGCPDIADKDGDGIADAQDKCPDKPETKNKYQDEDGCPDEVPADVQKLLAGPVAGVMWAKDGKLDDKKSAAALQPIAETLVKHEGAKITLKLAAGAGDKAAAQAKADAIKAFLVSRGVETERVEAVGEESATPAPAPEPAGKKKAKAAPTPPDVITITLR